MNEQNSNPLIRFLDDQTTKTLQEIKQKALENRKAIDHLKTTLFEAQAKIREILKELV